MKQLSLRSYCCLRNFLPHNVLHLCCVKHSITRTARSRTSFKWTKQMSVNWSPVHTNTLQMGAVRPSKWVSNGALADITAVPKFRQQTKERHHERDHSERWHNHLLQGLGQGAGCHVFTRMASEFGCVERPTSFSCPEWLSRGRPRPARPPPLEPSFVGQRHEWTRR